MKNHPKQKNGFVLVGILIVIVIIAVLAFGGVFSSKENDNNNNINENNKATYENANRIVDETEKEIEELNQKNNEKILEELNLTK